MSMNMNNLLDIEKYFLLELTYCDNPEYADLKISPKHPVPIKSFLEAVTSCYNSSDLQIRHNSDKAQHYRVELQRRLTEVYDNSDNLKDVEIIGYINDNYGFLSNTRKHKKTGLVAFAFRDSQGNGMVIYRGCELNTLRGIVLDWTGCIVSALGYVTSQHKKALHFFDDYMKALPGERNILGHSKGGNLSTYVFINRKADNVNCFIVNAQPYCWFAMTEEQRAWLKSSQFEYIMHTNDPTRAASYVSYISRVIPLNRYIKKDLLTKHFLFSAGFDDYGNLEGGRILRKTTSRVRSRVFHDYAQENQKTKEELMELFTKQMENISRSDRYLSVGIDEIMLALNAEAATLWFKSTDCSAGQEYIYPYLIKGPVNDELYKLKLYPGEGIAADSAFNGGIHLLNGMKQSEKFMNSVDDSSGFSSQSTVTVPLCNNKKEFIGALQILNKKDSEGFLQSDLDMALSMSEIIGNYLQSNVTTEKARDFTLLSVTSENGTIFEIERNEYKELSFHNQNEKDEFLHKITGKKLEAGELLMFNRDKFSPLQKDRLQKLRHLELSVIFKESKNKTKSTVKKVMEAKADLAKDKGIMKRRLFQDGRLEHILHKPVYLLTEEEYIQFEMELALLNRPMLIIVDTTKNSILKEGYEIVLEQVKDLTRRKMVTAIVLKLS